MRVAPEIKGHVYCITSKGIKISISTHISNINNLYPHYDWLGEKAVMVIQYT